MTPKIEQLAGDIVRRELEKSGYKITELDTGCYERFHASNKATGHAFCFNVEAQNNTQIDNATYYHLNKTVFEKLAERANNPYPTNVYFVDFELHRIVFAGVKALHDFINSKIEGEHAAVRIDDSIYFPLFCFNVFYSISLDDFTLYQKLLAQAAFGNVPTSLADKSTAAQIIIDLNKKKLGNMQTEFEQMIRGLIED